MELGLRIAVVSVTKHKINERLKLEREMLESYHYSVLRVTYCSLEPINNHINNECFCVLIIIHYSTQQKFNFVLKSSVEFDFVFLKIALASFYNK